MRRFFAVLFVLSLLATAGAYYWRTYYPELGSGSSTSAEPSAPRSLNPDGSGGADKRGLREAVRSPSGRQDLAVAISILSSIVSAFAAVMQTWLTARAFRR